MIAKWRAGHSIEEANFKVFHNECLTGILTKMLCNLYFCLHQVLLDLRCNKTT